MNHSTQAQLHQTTPKTYKERFAELLNWTVERKKVAAIDIEEEGNPPLLLRTNEYKANVRADTKRVLGIVGNRYTVVQNAECMEFCEEFTKSVDGSTIENCGTIEGGARVWFRVRLPESLKTCDLIPKLMIVNSHDGTTGVMFKVAFCTEDKKFIPTSGRHSIRHTLNADVRMGEIKKILKVASPKIAEYGDGLTKSMTYAMDKAERRKFFMRILKIDETTDSVDLNKRQKDALSDLEKCAQGHVAKELHGRGGDTAFQAFMAVVQFANMRAYDGVRKGHDQHETALKRMIDGACGELVESAFDEIVATCMQNALAATA